MFIKGFYDSRKFSFHSHFLLLRGRVLCALENINYSKNHCLKIFALKLNQVRLCNVSSTDMNLDVGLELFRLLIRPGRKQEVNK